MTCVRINIPAWGLAEIVAGFRAASSVDGREALARHLDGAVPGFAPVLLGSARAGLAAAVEALGLCGRPIAVPAYVCPAVLAGLRAARAQIVPVDCERFTARFDREILSRLASEGRIAGVVAPASYGIDQDMAALGTLGLPIIEDAAYAAGCLDGGGRPFGGRGTVGLWSFNFKALTAVGGGVLWVPRDGSVTVAPAAGRPSERRRFANYTVRAVARHWLPRFLPGFEPPEPFDPGCVPPTSLMEVERGAMSQVQAAIALVQWRRREALVALQSRNASALRSALDDVQIFRPLADSLTHLPHLFPIVVESREPRDAVLEARRALRRRGIQTENAYALADPRAARARELAERLLLVPCNASLGPARIRSIVSGLREAGRALLSHRGLDPRASVPTPC